MPTPFFADLVREMCHEGGTGPLTPTGAAPGHRRFADAVPVGATFHYAVAGAAWPGEWETGTGHIDDAGRLVRETVAASSNGGAHVDFAPGLKTIALTVGADWLAGLGDALAGKQPLSTSHAAAADGAEGDVLTVRRGVDWVNIPLAALAYRDASGRLLASGPLAGTDGTAGAPSISFGADPDTGLYRITANTLGFTTAGVERLRIGASGFIGVAIDPLARFHVRGPAADTAQLITRFDVANTAGTAAHGLRISADPAGNMVELASIGSFSGGYIFRCGTTEQVRIAANGSVGIGSPNPARALEVLGVSGMFVGDSKANNTNKSGRLFVPAYSSAVSGQVTALYSSATVTSNTIYVGGGTGTGQAATNVQFVTATSVDTATGTSRWVVAGSGHFFPIADITYNIGSSGSRVNNLYLANAPIVTSDGREKTAIRPLTTAELRAGKRIAGIIGIFQFLSAIAEKGEENAREHVGVVAQEVWAIMADEGLIDPADDEADPSSKYAFLCWDGWDEGHDEADDMARPAGDRFGIRVDQLLLFLLAAQEARLAALEAAA